MKVLLRATIVRLSLILSVAVLAGCSSLGPDNSGEAGSGQYPILTASKIIEALETGNWDCEEAEADPGSLASSLVECDPTADGWAGFGLSAHVYQSTAELVTDLESSCEEYPEYFSLMDEPDASTLVGGNWRIFNDPNLTKVESNELQQPLGGFVFPMSLCQSSDNILEQLELEVE